MKYLEEELDIKVHYLPYERQGELPYLITDRYDLARVQLDAVPALFVRPRGEIEDIPSLKKHLSLIGKGEDCPIVVILPSCNNRQRRFFIKNGTPFIVENRQIYLPFLGISLQERYSKEKNADEALLPSSQLLFFHYILNGEKNLRMNGLAERLSLSQMSISRSVKELEERELIETYKEGKNKIITSILGWKELYDKAQKYLRSPVKKRGFADKNAEIEGCLSSLSALSEMSMLLPPRIETMAVKRLEKEIVLHEDFLAEDTEKEIEVFSYDPLLLSSDGHIDILSLHQSLKDNEDERVQKELSILLDDFWEKRK